MKTQFEGLLGEVEELQKSMSAAAEGDEKIEAAAAEGEGAGDNEGAEAGEGDEDGEGEELGKSFTMRLEDGTEVDAIDGTELVKSLMARIEGNEESILKSFGGLMSVVKAQGDLIKSLTEKVGALSAAGRGRRAVLAISERPAPAAPEADKKDEGITSEAFMAKALTAQAAGRLNAVQVATAEACINRGETIPVHIVRAVMGDA